MGESRSSRPLGLYLAASLGWVGLLLSGCSGAEAQDVLGGASSSGASSSGASSSGASSGTSGAAGSSGANGNNCESEVEPNDKKGEANVLRPARCGSVSGDDEKDFLTFRLKPDTKTMSINFTGRVRLRVDVKGRDTVELTPESAGIVPFVTGEDYMIEVTSLTDSDAEVKWRVEVVEK
ncbi:MAG: hypothetical protein KF764_28195 [Labilithrix sp.]|nr:hypothetical protein [Labilithrix sp.]MBX3224214.1 hypothetical protein [Labilithrix sp.]